MVRVICTIPEELSQNKARTILLYYIEGFTYELWTGAKTIREAGIGKYYQPLCFHISKGMSALRRLKKLKVSGRELNVV